MLRELEAQLHSTGKDPKGEFEEKADWLQVPSEFRQCGRKALQFLGRWRYESTDASGQWKPIQ